MSYDGPDPTADRTVHVDQYTGKILAEVGYDDYSLPGKAMAVGIALHEGQMGLWNIVLNTLFCLGVILISISGIVMWWKRRPAGSLAAPPYPAGYRLPMAVMAIALAIIVLFPVTGIAVIAFAAIDFFWPTGRRLKAA